jgi:hypothetical protein
MRYRAGARHSLSLIAVEMVAFRFTAMEDASEAGAAVGARYVSVFENLGFDTLVRSRECEGVPRFSVNVTVDSEDADDDGEWVRTCVRLGVEIIECVSVTSIVSVPESPSVMVSSTGVRLTETIAVELGRLIVADTPT